MCGICGKFNFSNAPVEDGLIRRMCSVLTHRGPDHGDVYVSGRVGLGHRRLSIIDLSPAGHQPMCNERGDVWIVFNGEIYNFLDLLPELRERGHRFRSRSDTEVVVHAYEEYGEDCVPLFNGAFAFAIWDERARKLLLARDRLGIRPLYYATTDESIVFASETKAILLDESVSRKPELDFASIDHYVTHRRVSNASTMFKSIKKLLPAHTLLCQDGKLKIDRYWQVNVEENGHGRANDYIEQFFELFRDAVRLRLISDVPLGAHLSGGIDSSSIVALMAAMSDRSVETFSVGFDSDIDELDQARGVADYFGTSHHEIVARPEDFDLLPEIVWHLDEPIGDPIIIPTYLLSRLTHEYVKVVLTGEGADEILGGYVHQVCMTYGELYKSMVPGFIRSGVVSPIVNLASSKVLDRFFPYPASLGPDGKNRLVSYLRSPRYLSQSYSLLGSLFTEEDKEDLYTEDFARLVRDDKPEVDLFSDLRPEGNTLNRLIAHDLRTWLPDYTLFKQDKIAMSHSLETRVPFLDHRLVEFTARIPASLKLRGLTTKYILRKAMSGVLPKSAVHRKKQAFYMPVEECFRTGFEEFVAAILSESTVRKRGYFNYDYIQKVLQKAKDSPLIYNKQIMALVILELWHRLYVDELTSNLNRGEGTLAELSAKATICS